jgi:hypothetical protein
MTLDRALADAPRWMFLCILVYAPLAYGCTRPVTIAVLNQFSAALVVLWGAACVGGGRGLAVPWLPAALLALLLLQGWWFVWNAHSIHTYRTWVTLNRIFIESLWPDWPGAIDRDLARAAMMSLTALSALFLFACDLLARPVWRKRVWAAMALTAFAVAVLGVALKLGGPEARRWLWDERVAQGATTFAAYRYHGNAASMMSIGWALGLGFAIAAFGRPGRPLVRVGWMLVLLGLLAGLFMNTSRAGWGLAVLVLAVVGARFLLARWRLLGWDVEWRGALLQGAALLAVAAAFVTVALSTDWREKLTRFNTAGQALESRYPARVYHEVVRETGALGHGAGCFQVVLPVYMEIFGMATENQGFWEHAHNDYYEFLINWGWWGMALWVLLVGGGLLAGLRDHFRAPIHWGGTQWVLGFCGVAAAGGILVHSLWDFPLQKASILLYFLTLVADGWARLGVPEPDRERANLVQAD